MKKTIDRKTYNTETAELIGSWSNGRSYSDFSPCSEAVYKTKKGNFFIHGSGGPMSRYSESNGNTTSGGSDIIPVTVEGAIEWCEKRECEEAIEKYFSEFVVEA